MEEKTYSESTRKKLRFGIGKRFLEVRHGLRVILRETTGPLLQINPAKGYGPKLERRGRESSVEEENRRGGALLPTMRSTPERLVWVLEATV